MEATVNGTTIFYERLGSGPPVVLIHGLGGTGRGIWESTLPALSDAFEVLLPDIRGHGRSGSPPPPWTMNDFADDMAGLLRALALGPAHLVGHSMCVSVALLVAIRHPDLVRSVVGVNGPTTLPEGARSNLRARAEKVEAEGMAAVAEAVATGALSQPFREAHPDRFQAYQELLKANRPGSYAAACRALADLDIVNQLGAVRVPALFTAGDIDPVAPLPLVEIGHRGVAGSQLRVIERCAHVPSWEQPAALNQLLREFLAAQR